MKNNLPRGKLHKHMQGHHMLYSIMFLRNSDEEQFVEQELTQTHTQATNALLDREELDVETTNPLYEIFTSNGYAGTQDDFIRDFFPDASPEELADLNFVGQALQGGMSLTDISSDPFTAMSQFESFLGGSDKDLYGVDSDRDFESESNYFDLFPDEEDYATDTGRGIIDSWTGGLFG